MAAVAWKPLFWERFGDAFVLAGHARGLLAAVAGDLASPLRGVDDVSALALIKDCGDRLAYASRHLAFAISALGVVELLALRCMRTDDVEETRARSRARAARDRSCDAYDSVAASRGHLGATGRLVDSNRILDDAIDLERLAFLADMEAATGVIDGMQALRTSDATIADITLPRADTHTDTSGSAASAPTIGDAAWSLVGGSVPGALLRVALSGALPEIEAAQAALQVGADAVDKRSKVTVDTAAAAAAAAADDWPAWYREAFLALDAAHGALSQLLALKKEADLLFLHCAPPLRLNRGGPGWQSWDASRSDAERHGRAALDHLWSASTFIDCCFAGVLAWGWGTPTSTSSGQEALELMRRALADAAQARDAGDLLRHAAGRAFFHAWMVLKEAASS